MLNKFSTRTLTLPDSVHTSHMVRTYNMVRDRVPRNVSVWLAGGCIRNYAFGGTIKDYDIFLNGDVDLDVFKDFKVVPPAEFHPSEKFMVTQFRTHPTALPTQVMVIHKLHTTEGLLDLFDWDISLYAYDGTSFVTRDQNTGTRTKLVLQDTKNPYSSLRRGYRFTERYGLKFDHRSLLYLCNKINEDYSRYDYN